MSSRTRPTGETAGPSEASDYLTRLARGGYLLATLLFAGGIYVDWHAAGRVVVPVLSFTDDPYSNSGLFVLAVAVGLSSYALDRGADRLAQHRRDGGDETQEYTVDVDSKY